MKRIVTVFVAMVLLLSLVPAGTVGVAAAGVLGDVDGNGTVDSTDARLVLQYTVGKSGASRFDLTQADVDGSGTVDSSDARLILQFSVRKINGFPDKMRQLAVMINDETVRLSFADVEECEGYLCYNYVGISPAGNRVESKVIPTVNAVYGVTYTPANEEEFTHGLTEVHDFLKAAFQKMGMNLPGKTDIMMYTDGPFDGQEYVNVSAWFKYDYMNHSEYVAVTLKQADGKLYIAEIRAQGLDGGKLTTPFMVEKQQAYFVPDWV